MRSTGAIEVGRWLGERLPVSTSRLRAAANERLPAYLKRWWFALGGTVGYLLVLQIVTGVLLAFYYETAPQRAYESVRYITHEAAFGWYLRSVHKWAATLMIAALILHQVRVFFTGAYRKPREINWIVGMCLLICTLLIGFTGYSLVYEQLSFWGATVGANIAERVPLVGGLLKSMLLGGEAYNSRTLSRFFVLHAAVLPFLMIVLIAIHIAIVRIQGVADLDSRRRGDRGAARYDLFPHHFYTELVIALSLMVVLSALACIFPATMGPAANPNVTPDEIQPEWFFFAAFRWLKLFSGTAAVLSMGFIVLLMFAWPFVDAQIRRRTRFREASVWIGLAGVLAIVGLTLWEAIAPH
jgi:quinol-cytochrome oxidoreductase complex cytochrome b subunit